MTTMKNGLSIKNIAKELKDKRFSFFPTHRKLSNAIAHLHIWLPAHTQSRHRKATKRANLPTHFFYMYSKMIFFNFENKENMCNLSNYKHLVEVL